MKRYHSSTRFQNVSLFIHFFYPSKDEIKEEKKNKNACFCADSLNIGIASCALGDESNLCERSIINRT